MRVAGLLAFVLIAGQAGAQALDRSPRPQANPLFLAAQGQPAETVIPPVAVTEAVLRPRPRPEALVPAGPADAGNTPQAAPTAVAAASLAPRGLFAGLLRPRARPEGGVAAVPAAVRVKPSRSATTSRKGSVCGDPAIKGEEMSPIKGKIRGCGVADPVRVTSVAGVQLSTPATVDCPTAKALKRWVEKGLQPAMGRNAAVELEIAAHYVCRSRNNIRGAKVSEHGRGRAIDISGVVRRDGSTLSVARHFSKLRRAHKAACGIFGTTLGPGSDGYHEDHMHFDTARHGNGAYCR